MKTWKRNLLIAYVACSAVVVAVYFAMVFSSSMWALLKVLLTLVGVVAACGAAVGVYYVVYAFVHSRATLHAGPDGSIDIERSALEATARRAVESVEGVSLQRVAAKVVSRKGVPVIDFSVTAVPYGTDSLMTTAGRIQTSVKRAVESFTDHEVRYVAVSFLEPRRRDMARAAAAAEEARAASGYVPPRYAAAQTQPAAQHEDAPGDVRREEDAPAEPSLWERLKGRVAKRTSRDSDENVVETVATVEDATGPEVVGDGMDEAARCDGSCGEGVSAFVETGSEAPASIDADAAKAEAVAEVEGHVEGR